MLTGGVLAGCDSSQPTQAPAAVPASNTGNQEQPRPRVPYRNLTRAQALELLSTADPSALANQVSALAQDRQNPVVCNLLNALWDGTPIPDVEISPQLTSTTRVRLALASTLHQCSMTDDQSYRAYVLSVLESAGNEIDRSRAALVLGIVGGDEDVPRLRAMAQDHTSSAVGIGAVGGLSTLGSSAARKALEEIAADEKVMPEVKDVANRMLK